MTTTTIRPSRGRTVSMATAVGSLATLLLVGPGVAPALAQADASDMPRIISVAGTGFAESEPDEVSLRLGVSVRGATAEQVTDEAAAAMQAVVDALVASGIDAADIRTARLDLGRVRERDPRSGRRIAAGWQVHNMVTATSGDVERIGDILDAAVAAGATDVDRVWFSVSDPTSALAEAREAAVEAAALAAEQLASFSGVELGEVLAITEGGRSMPSPYALRAEAYLGVGDTAGGATPVLPGTIETAVTVYIDYAID